MAHPAPLHSVYVGIARDMSRDQTPAGYVWNMQDFIPTQQGAPLRKRGGWTYASSAISGTAYIDKVAWGQLTGFPQSPRFIAIDAATGGSGPNVYKMDETTGAVTSVGSVSSVSGSINLTVGDPHVYGSHFFIPLGWTEGMTGDTSDFAACTQYDGTNLQKVVISAFSGVDSPAGARYATDYKSYLVLGSTAKNPSRIWFGDPGITTAAFSTTSAWIDLPLKLTGMVTVPNAMLFFSNNTTTRIRGSIPPPDSDMYVDFFSDYGCCDAGSIATWNGQALRADTNGVYLTDGINDIDITEAGFIRNYYRDLLAGWDTTWVLKGGVFRGYYFLTIANGSRTFQDCLVCDIRRRTWFRFQNFNFRSFTESSTTRQAFFAACADTNRVANLTGIFSPSASNKTDADGDAVLPVVEYPMRRGFSRVGRRWLPAAGLTHFKRLYLTYELTDAASDNPILTFSYVNTPDATSYTTLAYTLAENTAVKRVGRSFGPTGARGGVTKQELGVKIAQTGASAETKVYSLEAEYEVIEGSVLEQS